MFLGIYLLLLIPLPVIEPRFLMPATIVSKVSDASLKFLSVEIAALLANSIISSQIDDSLFYGVNKHNVA